MKSSKQLGRRSVSPLGSKMVEVSQRKKKIVTNPYRPVLKQFDTYGRTDKKQHSNYLKELLRGQQPTNKYRIVTEPVDDRIMHLVSSSFKRSSKSKPRLQESETGLQFKVRATHSKQRSKKLLKVWTIGYRYQQQLQTFKTQYKKLVNNRTAWKNGSMSLKSFYNELKLQTSSGRKTLVGRSTNQRVLQQILQDAKKHFYDLMRDVESLTEIDYPKMLSLKVEDRIMQAFRYEPCFSDNVSTQKMSEMKEYLSRLRDSAEGRIIQWDLESCTEQSQHIKSIIRNLSARLNHCLRQNLDLRTAKALLQKGESFSDQSEEYLRLLIEDVLKSYIVKS